MRSRYRTSSRGLRRMGCELCGRTRKLDAADMAGGAPPDRSLQMKERAQDSAPRWQDAAFGTHDVQQFTSRGLGSFEKRWPAELPRDDSGMAQYGPGGWRDAKDPQQIGDAFWGCALMRMLNGSMR